MLEVRRPPNRGVFFRTAGSWGLRRQGQQVCAMRRPPFTSEPPITLILTLPLPLTLTTYKDSKRVQSATTPSLLEP